MERLITIKEASERLGVSRWTITQWIKRGDLPAIRIGGKRRIPESVLENWKRLGSNFAPERGDETK